MDSKKIKKIARSSESASLLQQEHEKLQATAEALRAEWSKLKDEMDHLLEECGSVKDENKSAMEALTKIYGKDAVLDLVAMECDADSESDSEEKNQSN